MPHAASTEAHEARIGKSRWVGTAFVMFRTAWGTARHIQSVRYGTGKDRQTSTSATADNTRPARERADHAAAAPASNARRTLQPGWRSVASPAEGDTGSRAAGNMAPIIGWSMDASVGGVAGGAMTRRDTKT